MNIFRIFKNFDPGMIPDTPEEWGKYGVMSISIDSYKSLINIDFFGKKDELILDFNDSLPVFNKYDDTEISRCIITYNQNATELEFFSVTYYKELEKIVFSKNGNILCDVTNSYYSIEAVEEETTWSFDGVYSSIEESISEIRNYN